LINNRASHLRFLDDFPLLNLRSLENAIASLDQAINRCRSSPEDELLRDGCIQRFEYTFELSWKMIKRRLMLDLPDPREADTSSYRDLIRIAHRVGLIQEVEAWWNYRELRNLTSHAYDAAKARLVQERIPDFAKNASLMLAQLKNCGDAPRA
jgi:nucleotidyltransferase substrate binding protein (TIGR01987 family)